MNEGLRQALMERFGARYADGPGAPVVSPADERELAAVLELLRRFGGAAHRDVEISRSRIGGIEAPEPTSATIRAEAGARLAGVERRAREVGLSLGPLSPGAMTLDVAAFIEGPYAGLRAVRGGRLEPVPLALSALLADGRAYRSHASPRSAAGPDLDAWFCGGGGRAGVLTGAVLRLLPAQRSVARRFEFSEAGALVRALRAVVGIGCCLEGARVDRGGTGFVLTLVLSGTDDSLPIDEGSAVAACARQGRALQDGAAAAPEGVPSGAERELGWDDVSAALGGAGAVSLHRLSLETVIATGAGEAGEALTDGGRWSTPALGAVLQAVDPRGVLGGAP